MKLKARNRFSTGFSLSSMTDIVFLLLIFFILSSEVTRQRALDLILPTANGHKSESIMPTVKITKDLSFYVNDKITDKTKIAESLDAILKNQNEKQFLIQSDKQVPVQEVVFVLDIAHKKSYKATLATESN